MKISAATWGRNVQETSQGRKSFQDIPLTFHTMQTSVLFRNFAVGWSTREMIANASKAPRAIF